MRRLCVAALSVVALAGCDRMRSGEQVDVVRQGDYEIVLSRPDPGSERARAFRDLGQASRFVLYSLHPETPLFAPESTHAYGTPEYEAEVSAKVEAERRRRAADCLRTGCIGRNPVLGKVTVDAEADRRVLRDILARSLGKVPSYESACIAEYRHAIAFVADGRNYQVLLCYGCGQVAVGVDGEFDRDEQTYDMGNEADLDAILRKAHIRLAPKRE